MNGTERSASLVHLPAIGASIAALTSRHRNRLRRGYWRTSILTFATPGPTIPSVAAAEYETSTARPGTNGPRSLTRTVTDRPVATFVRRNRVPNGKVRCAAV